MPSRAWDYFMENFFGDPYMMWHDGINPTSAAQLEGEEREKGEQMLIDSMNEGSYWAPMGLGEMGSVKALPHLKEKLTDAFPRQLIEIAIALNKIENTTEYVPYIIKVLQQAGSPYDRLVAAMKLRYYTTPDVIPALFDAVLDPDYLVRNHASESLLHLHGLPATISQYKEIFRLICVESRTEDDELITTSLDDYRRAVKLLKDIFAEKQ